MPELTVEARKTLKQSFEEIAERASRLGEWISYQERLRPLQSNFVTVWREVEGGIVNGSIAPDALSRIRNAWTTCRQFGLVDLELFSEGIRYIHKPLNDGVKVRYDTAKFFALRDLIETDVRRSSAMDLKDHCSEFDTAISVQIAILLTTLKYEMQELCTLTQQLYQDFGRD